MPTCHFGENSKQVLSRLVPLGKMIYLGHILCNRYKCGARYDFMKLFFSFFNAYLPLGVLEQLLGRQQSSHPA